MWDAIGSAIAGGAQAGGDVLNYFGAQANTNATNAANQAIANQNIAMQQDFAQNGISWRIADAAKNNISPLAALGAAEPSFSPVSQVFTAPESGYTAAGSALSDLGQNVSRALTSQQSPEDKAAAKLSLAHSAKENDLLDLQIANAKRSLMFPPGSGPGVPSGPTPAFQWVTNADNSQTMIPTYNTRDTPMGGATWMMNNKLIPGVEDLYTNLVSHDGSNAAPAAPLSYYSTGR